MSIQQVYDRAAADPDFAEHLKTDFRGTVREAGIELTPEEIREAVGMEDATEERAVDELQARVSKTLLLGKH